MKRILLFFIFFNGVLFSETQKILAILNIEPKGEVKEDIAEFVSERLRIEVFKIGKYRLVERQKINKVIEEQKIFLLNEHEDYVRKVGGLLSADEIMVGSLSYLSGSYYLNIKIIDVKTSEMVFGETEKADNVSDLSVAAERIANAISGADKTIDLKNKIPVQEINRIVKSVLDYAVNIAEKQKNQGLTNTLSLTNQTLTNKKEEKSDDFFKFGGGPVIKYFNNRSVVLKDNIYDTIGLFLFGFKGIFGFWDTVGVGFAGNIGGSYIEYNTNSYAGGLVYGGVTLDLYRKFFNFIRLDLNCLFGWGMENFYLFSGTNYQNISYESRNSFFVIEPGAMVSFNIFNVFELGLTASYTYTSPMSEIMAPNRYNFGAFFIFGL
ncbi:MAG: CsgG/HfaB family protein [Brevinematales bacterium]|nr:CsgG/HfaB family protein [Brevinematales bacterium]